MSSPSEVLRLDLPFAAPVPRGHDVGYATVSHPDAGLAGELLLFDRSAGVTYCQERMHAVLAHPQMVGDPFFGARAHGWKVEQQVLGRVLAAMVSTQPGRALPALRTTLFVELERSTQPYR